MAARAHRTLFPSSTLDNNNAIIILNAPPAHNDMLISETNEA